MKKLLHCLERLVAALLFLPTACVALSLLAVALAVVLAGLAFLVVAISAAAIPTALGFVAFYRRSQEKPTSWWCYSCQRTLEPHEVTHDDTCTSCHNHVTTDKPCGS